MTGPDPAGGSAAGAGTSCSPAQTGRRPSELSSDGAALAGAAGAIGTGATGAGATGACAHTGPAHRTAAQTKLLIRIWKASAQLESRPTVSRQPTLRSVGRNFSCA